MTRHSVRPATSPRSLSRHRIPRRNGRARCEERRSSPMPTTDLIDVKFGVIMDVEASRAIRRAEVRADQPANRWRLKR